MKKNKVAPPLKVCKYDFMFASGINSAGCLLDVAETLQLAVRKVRLLLSAAWPDPIHAL